MDSLLKNILKSIFGPLFFAEKGSRSIDHCKLIVIQKLVETDTLTAPLQKPLLEILNHNEVSISQSCGGMGTCGTCKLKIIDGADRLSPMTELENDRDLPLQTNERLACQTQIQHISNSKPLIVEIIFPQ